MTVNEIVDELRAGRPHASDALRLQVMSIAARPVPRRPTLSERFAGRRRLALLVPASAALALTAAVAIGISRSGSPGSVGTAAPEANARSAGAAGESLAAPPAAADASAALDERVEEAFVEGLSPELEAALMSLSAGEREVLALRVVLELDGDATARVLGISPTAVSTRLSRALKRLEERVNEE